MPTNVNISGVSNCYVFKSQLQEYAQKAGLSTPVYDTIKEGPSHEPSFRSTVIVNDVRYNSLPGFFNRKAAEHSAAEVALMELSKAGEFNESVSQPVHETGLCKNLLQEYAQKMNHAMPLYYCQKDETAGRLAHYSCTVEIGGIRYIGGAAKTKKEAEIKAARIALLAIQSSASELSIYALGNSQLVVTPCRKRVAETANNPDETVKFPKAKKARFKKKLLRKKQSRKNTDRFQDETTGIPVTGSDDLLKSEGGRTDSLTILSSETLGTQVTGIPPDTKIESDLSEQDMSSVDVALAHQVADNSVEGGQTDSLAILSSETLGTQVTGIPPDTKIESDLSEQDMPSVDVALAHQVADNSVEGGRTDSLTILSSETLGTQVTGIPPDTKIESDLSEQDMPSVDVASAHQVADNSKIGHLPAVNSTYSSHEAPDMENSIVYDGLANLVKSNDDNEIAPMVNDPTLGQVSWEKDIVKEAEEASALGGKLGLSVIGAEKEVVAELKQEVSRRPALN